MIYTAHIGQRSDEWPQRLPGDFPTRSAAQDAVKAALMLPAARSMDLTKGEVRLSHRLLDCYSRRTASVRIIYSAKQRERNP